MASCQADSFLLSSFCFVAILIIANGSIFFNGRIMKAKPRCIMLLSVREKQLLNIL